MNLELNEKIVCITGASGGIGLAIARAFLEEGAIVCATYRNQASKLAQLKTELDSDQAARLHAFHLDLADFESHQRCLKELTTQFERIDVLVNCAGSALEKPFLLLSAEEIVQQVETNFTHQILFTQHVVKRMLVQRKGAVVSISSLLGKRLGRGVAVYAAAKAAFDRYTQTLALEVGKKGIRVNSINPGLIATKMSKNIQTNMPAELIGMSPTPRPGRPEEIANAVLFLASDKAASYITGVNLSVDGGLGI
ncbi:MAG: 3-oxoacyl-[acyl-carrier-protein] reductase [Bacteroidota bacterium]|jgi:NAD(P)-dependent dehydrogenase (short-subunit alcohol dehydrogenase family)